MEWERWKISWETERKIGTKIIWAKWAKDILLEKLHIK